MSAPAAPTVEELLPGTARRTPLVLAAARLEAGAATRALALAADREPDADDVHTAAHRACAPLAAATASSGDLAPSVLLAAAWRHADAADRAADEHRAARRAADPGSPEWDDDYWFNLI